MDNGNDNKDNIIIKKIQITVIKTTTRIIVLTITGVTSMIITTATATIQVNQYQDIRDPL